MFAQNIVSLYRHRELIKEMTIRNLKGFSKGAVLGISWIVISPLIQVTVYVVIVSYIFKAKLNPNAGTFDYVMYVLSGMIPWQILNRSISEAPILIHSNIELVKQVVYPIETLPLTKIFVSSFRSIVSFVIFLALMLISGNINWTIVFFPIPVFFLLLFILGISWLFSIVGVILKDLKEMVTIFMALIIYVSPVIASKEMVGEVIWKIIMLNPLAHIIIAFRDVFWAEFHPISWVIFIFISVAFFLLGNRVMMRAKTLINEYI